MGVATVTIVTDEFAKLGKLEASALGMPGLPLVILPHPIADLKPEQVWALAEQTLLEVIRLLTTPADQLNQEFKTKVYPEPRRIFKPRPTSA